MARPAQRHVIVHQGVGPFTEGMIVPGPDAEWPAGTDLERLVRLGAIAPLSSAEARDLEEADATQGGIYDPLRTENPPTLPRPEDEGVPEHTIPVGGEMSGAPEALDTPAKVRRAGRETRE